jgi:hypothetical protein
MNEQQPIGFQKLCDAETQKNIDGLHRKLDNHEITEDPPKAVQYGLQIAHMSIALLWEKNALEMLEYAASNAPEHPAPGAMVALEARRRSHALTQEYFRALQEAFCEARGVSYPGKGG